MLAVRVEMSSAGPRLGGRYPKQATGCDLISRKILPDLNVSDDDDDKTGLEGGNCIEHLVRVFRDISKPLTSSPM